MKDSFLKIAEVAKKESHTGYGDYAVFGGFSAFIEEILEGDGSDDADLLRGVARHYADSNLRTRKSIVELILKLLVDMEKAEPQAPLAGEETVLDAPAEVWPLGGEDDTEYPAPDEEFPVEGNASPREKSDAPAKKRSEIPKELCYLKGVGPKKAELLKKLGIDSVYDLCEYFPRRHEDRRFVREISSLRDGETALISGYVDGVQLNRVRGRLQILKARLTDGTGFITVVWFNQPWLKNQLYDGRELTVYGKAEINGGRRSLNAMEYELKRCESGFGILPVYGLTAGINQKTMRKIVQGALDLCGDALEDFFPEDFRQRYRLMERAAAIRQYHCPTDFEALRKSHFRLVFEEFFLFRLAFRLRHDGEKKDGIAMKRGSAEEFFGLLPFVPTNAQRRVIGEIFDDMAAPVMMNRLLEGDVGSGKTVVAAAALWRAFQNGRQTALMAPTEILAEQHYQSMKSLFENSDMNIALLTGSTKAAEKRKICKELAEGSIDLIIGTHALIEDNAAFHDLALVIIDEQHRFGVNQRNALFMKGCSPDMLVMTATPIPRTLAMTVFAGLDLSVLDEMPPGRKPVRTMVITDDEETRALTFIKKHVAVGHQCYIVCPLVEESENVDAEAATRFYLQLKNGALKGISLGLVHGKMKGAEKEAVLEKFRRNEISVLVSTTVIEVGIDVPNATVMYVKNADRFGLAQLHQIRGRIGRGEAAATCLLQSGAKNESTVARLKVMERYSDGFQIAEEDLKLRGPGDFFGVRQHGLPEMNLADLFRDHELLTAAAAAVDDLLLNDPELTDPAWAKTKAYLGHKGKFVNA